MKTETTTSRECEAKSSLAHARSLLSPRSLAPLPLSHSPPFAIKKRRRKLALLSFLHFILSGRSPSTCIPRRWRGEVARGWLPGRRRARPCRGRRCRASLIVKPRHRPACFWPTGKAMSVRFGRFLPLACSLPLSKLVHSDVVLPMRVKRGPAGSFFQARRRHHV